MKKYFLKITFLAGLAVSSFNSLKAQANLLASSNKSQSTDEGKKDDVSATNLPTATENKQTAKVIATAKNSSSSSASSSLKSKITYGIASFYAKYFEGALTATGEIFHQTYFTAASNNFKLNTWVRVSNLLNGKSIIVRINDRMHPRMAAQGRVVDLTVAAAKMLSFTSAGITRVKVEVVPKGTTN
jgi:rare lipoprotein A (peptidoglycan hydrolase)